jgi:hypothetical protein
MKIIATTITCIGALMLAKHLFSGFITGYATMDGSDISAVLLLAIAVRLTFQE